MHPGKRGAADGRPPRLIPTLLALLLGMAVRAPAGGCGTEAWFRNRARSPATVSASPSHPAAKAASVRTSAAPPYRTLESAHFLIRYSLRGIHRIRFTAADAALRRALDSLYAPLLPADQTDDAAVIAALDRAGAPHPAFAALMSDLFEQAHAYYVGRLGMRAPQSFGPSLFFRAPPQAGKYAVDVADAFLASWAHDPQIEVQPKTYGVTMPASQGGMIMDNDFRYGSSLSPSGDSALGNPLQVCLPASCDGGGAVFRDYAVDWEAGLRVTVFHELYHAVQLTYTPDPGTGYHVWYETGAVGMEERKAPDVDDYLQYLPEFFRNLSGTGMFAYPDLIQNTDPLYGNGIFHTYLTWKLGEDFDVGLWSLLERNGNDIRDALSKVIAAHGLTTEQVYAGFAAQLAFSGRAARAPFASFSPDLPRWPRLPAADLDLDSRPTLRTPLQAPFTVAAFSVTGSVGGRSLFPQATSLAPILATLTADSGGISFPSANPATLLWPPPSGAERLLVLANASMAKSAAAEIRVHASLLSDRLFAYPNPLFRSGGDNRILFSRFPGGGGARIRIVAENGVLVRQLSFAADSALWSWDLRGGKQGKTETPVLPGLYYYGTEGALAPLIIY
jgi:hypothetical protein